MQFIQSYVEWFHTIMNLFTNLNQSIHLHMPIHQLNGPVCLKDQQQVIVTAQSLTNGPLRYSVTSIWLCGLVNARGYCCH